MIIHSVPENTRPEHTRGEPAVHGLTVYLGLGSPPSWRHSAIIPRMPEPDKPAAPIPTPPAARPAADADKVLCERCGAEMFRMHAVWRCPVCRYKTDCCGW